MMSVIQKMFDAWDAKDKSAVESIVHDDFVMTSHAQGAKMTKQDMLGWLEGPQPKTDKFRIITMAIDTNAYTEEFLIFVFSSGIQLPFSECLKSFASQKD